MIPLPIRANEGPDQRYARQDPERADDRAAVDGLRPATAAPGLPRFLGSFSGALFGNPLPVLAVFYVCVGSTVAVETTPYVLRKGGVLLMTKAACGLLCAVVLGHVLGNGPVSCGFFSGLSVLAVVAAVNDTNGGLYMALTGQYGRTRDAAAYSVMSLESGPFLTMLTLGWRGWQRSRGRRCWARWCPSWLACCWATWTQRCVSSWGGGCRCSCRSLPLHSGRRSTPQTSGTPGCSGWHWLFVVAFSGSALWLADRATGGTGVAGLAAASTAGNAAAVPALVAAANPAYSAAAADATVLVSASVVVTAIVVPLLTAWAARRGSAFPESGRQPAAPAQVAPRALSQAVQESRS